MILKRCCPEWCDDSDLEEELPSVQLREVSVQASDAPVPAVHPAMEDRGECSRPKLAMSERYAPSSSCSMGGGRTGGSWY